MTSNAAVFLYSGFCTLAYAVSQLWCEWYVVIFLVYLEKVHRPGNKVVFVHCVELPELSIGRASKCLQLLFSFDAFINLFFFSCILERLFAYSIVCMHLCKGGLQFGCMQWLDLSHSISARYLAILLFCNIIIWSHSLWIQQYFKKIQPYIVMTVAWHPSFLAYCHNRFIWIRAFYNSILLLLLKFISEYFDYSGVA